MSTIPTKWELINSQLLLMNNLFKPILELLFQLKELLNKTLKNKPILLMILNGFPKVLSPQLKIKANVDHAGLSLLLVLLKD